MMTHESIYHKMSASEKALWDAREKALWAAFDEMDYLFPVVYLDAADLLDPGWDTIVFPVYLEMRSAGEEPVPFQLDKRWYMYVSGWHEGEPNIADLVRDVIEEEDGVAIFYEPDRVVRIKEHSAQERTPEFVLGDDDWDRRDSWRVRHRFAIQRKIA